ncbi:helix-turn-helix transcriptional regulator [Spirosoma sp. SC4-14]|uniref:helix-turn-helix domain-containing protein n=1 Tax=Spirosoma sp. SC4-14 TaxID=3128900 RepID=UPI0030CFD834
MSLSYNVKQFRKAKGLSQEYMAEKLHMSQPTYHRLESSDRRCEQFLCQLADALETTTDALRNDQTTTETESANTLLTEQAAIIEQQQTELTFLKRYTHYLEATWREYGSGRR